MDHHLSTHKITPQGLVHRNLSIETLVSHALRKKEVVPSKTGAVVVYTGKYTGRSPNDKFIVDTPLVHDQIDWGKVNMPITERYFKKLYKKMSLYLSALDQLYIFDGFAGADEKYKLHVRVVSEYAYQSLFMQHLLRRPTPDELKAHTPTFTVLCAPGCVSDPATDGTNSEAFIILNVEKMFVMIGGTKYAGEMKKSIFTVLNYLLPLQGVLPMHSSANIGKDGTSALFFGLSGTGKTTLSADPDRMLIGDDEHGWSENGIFNFEGGCYAKCINLKKTSEPLIWNAIRDGALVENVVLKKDGSFDFTDDSITENTRVGFPIHYIEDTVVSGVGPHPKTAIFLTADAFGVLPPVARLNIDASVYHFLSGYTSKLAGTERGITTPKATFSAYFGAPFMPLKPKVYADLLKKYLKKYKRDVYLINTGWIGGGYGVGKRISIE
ncbi:MAG: phosphoenolpyruvate carboxykinase (ATP), partial [Candidatus Levybacteria bacterium]|nr:phosphoenolpyruvate carboxykinase (ATP) [Candidatus Levybacteria bacterium]